MKEFDDLLNLCHKGMITTSCNSCQYNQCRHPRCSDCYQCLYDLHRIGNNTRHYQCNKIRYNYILKYFPRYASEIASGYSMILSDIINITNPLNIYSLGCGPASELFGIMAINRLRKHPDNILHYKGFDISSDWSGITTYIKGMFSSASIDFIQQDMFTYIKKSSEHIDILIVNYMLSDMMRYDKIVAKAVIKNIYDLLATNQVSYVLINDIALFYANGNNRSAYWCMKELETLVDTSSQKCAIYYRYRFSEPNPFQVQYGQKLNDKQLFSIPQIVNSTYNPFSQCGSIMLVVKRI